MSNRRVSRITCVLFVIWGTTAAAHGVWTALFPDRLLFVNVGAKPVDVKRSWNGREIKLHLESG